MFNKLPCGRKDLRGLSLIGLGEAGCEGERSAAVEEAEGVEGEKERELGMGKLSLPHCERAVSRTLH